MGLTGRVYMYIYYMLDLPVTQDAIITTRLMILYIFSDGIPYKPLFATVNGCGVDPNYVDVH